MPQTPAINNINNFLASQFKKRTLHKSPIFNIYAKTSKIFQHISKFSSIKFGMNCCNNINQTLAGIRSGEKCVILKVLPQNPKYQTRLLELGFTSGTQIGVLKKSVLGKTLLVKIRGYVIAIKQDLAKTIIVERI